MSFQEQATILWSYNLALSLRVKLFLEDSICLRVMAALFLPQPAWEDVFHVGLTSPVPKLSSDKLGSAKKVVGHC